MGRGRVYTVEFSGARVTARMDLFEISPADDKPCRLLGLFITQSSDVGDSAEEILRFQIIRGHTTSGSVGTGAPTPRPILPNDAAAGFAAEMLNTTLATGGSPVNLHSEAFNIRSGYGNWWPPECCITVAQPNTCLVVRLQDAPADELFMTSTIYVEELV